MIWRGKKDVLSCTPQHVCLCYLTKRTGSFVVRPSRSWRSNLEIPDILIWQFLLLTFIHALYLIQIFRCLYSKYNFPSFYGTTTTSMDMRIQDFSKNKILIAKLKLFFECGKTTYVFTYILHILLPSFCRKNSVKSTFSLKNFTLNWFDEKKFAWQWVFRFSTLFVHSKNISSNQLFISNLCI